MDNILHMNQDKREELCRIQARTTELEPLLGLERDGQGMSLNKSAITNPFAARRLDQIRSEHSAEWEEYCNLAVKEMDLMMELGITTAVMDELFPEEKDIDMGTPFPEGAFRVVK